MNHVQRGTHWRIYTIGGRLACAVSAARAWQTSRTPQFVKCTQQRNCAVCLHPRRRHHHRKPMATLSHTPCPHTAHHHAWPVLGQTGKRLAERDLSKTKTHTGRWRWCVVGLVCWKGSCTHTHGRPSSPSVYHHHRKPIHLSHSHTHSHTHAHTQLSVSSQSRSHLPRSRFQGCPRIFERVLMDIRYLPTA